jgi:hypothetical protein
MNAAPLRQDNGTMSFLAHLNAQPEPPHFIWVRIAAENAVQIDGVAPLDVAKRCAHLSYWCRMNGEYRSRAWLDLADTLEAYVRGIQLAAAGQDQ